MMPIEEYALLDWLRLNEVAARLTAPEVRRCLDAEWGDRRRRAVLLRLTYRLWVCNRDAAIKIIRDTVPIKPGGRKLLTVPQLEASAWATFGPVRVGPRKGQPRLATPRVVQIQRASYVRLMRERKKKWTEEALAKMKAEGRSTLSQKEREELQRKTGDHFCREHLNAATLCEICGEAVDESQLQ